MSAEDLGGGAMTRFQASRWASGKTVTVMNFFLSVDCCYLSRAPERTGNAADLFTFSPLGLNPFCFLRTLCDNLRRERDRAVSDLAEALRNLDDMRKQKNDAVRELKELKCVKEALSMHLS